MRTGRIISSHPKLTPEKLADLQALAEKIDREEKDEIIALARAVFARRERVNATIARLKSARVERKLTLEQVAESSGIGKANLSRLENDPSPNPTIDTLLRVADAIGVEVLVK